MCCGLPHPLSKHFSYPESFMAHPWHHAVSSAKRFGGVPEDYLFLHHWMDSSKQFFGDFRHRALYHHAQGIFLGEQLHGVYVVTQSNRKVMTRTVLEQHVKEDLGVIPSVGDWLKTIQGAPWMFRHVKPLDMSEDNNDL